jgi:hypothetical protein
MIFRESWIPEEVRVSVEPELLKAFETELLKQFGSIDFVIDEQKFVLVCEEMESYTPETLASALPYVLVGFLRLRELTVEQAIAIASVLMLLNVRDYPFSDPRENPEDWQSALARAKDREKAVFYFSDHQSHAIRLWLEAVRNSHVFLPGESAYTDLNYAIAYWSDRE